MHQIQFMCKVKDDKIIGFLGMYMCVFNDKSTGYLLYNWNLINTLDRYFRSIKLTIINKIIVFIVEMMSTFL